MLKEYLKDGSGLTYRYYSVSIDRPKLNTNVIISKESVLRNNIMKQIIAKTSSMLWDINNGS